MCKDKHNVIQPEESSGLIVENSQQRNSVAKNLNVTHSFVTVSELGGGTQAEQDVLTSPAYGGAKKAKKTKKRRNLNVEAAYLHILGDVLNSCGVIIAASLIYLDQSLWFLDPLCTFFFGLIVFWTTRITLMQCIYILMEATPEEYDVDEIEKDLTQLEGVGRVHDIHVWSLSSGKCAFICHIDLDKEHNDLGSEVLAKADRLLRHKYRLNHLTIQMEKSCANHSKEDHDCSPGQLSDSSTESSYSCGNDLHI